MRKIATLAAALLMNNRRNGGRKTSQIIGLHGVKEDIPGNSTEATILRKLGRQENVMRDFVFRHLRPLKQN
ncbi:hypothetical protein O9992_09615 [Vibrio lentus]|nr:hypothetical protein [Vibrio lentus]